MRGGYHPIQYQPATSRPLTVRGSERWPCVNGTEFGPHAECASDNPNAAPATGTQIGTSGAEILRPRGEGVITRRSVRAERVRTAVGRSLFSEQT